ncbi:hypothetical protein BDR03DRAFT_105289 [Suillus americanus]|nr:hypothetical protein BDR03DRAFT_105289 [Suillus americanus]
MMTFIWRWSHGCVMMLNRSGGEPPVTSPSESLPLQLSPTPHCRVNQYRHFIALHAPYLLSPIIFLLPVYLSEFLYSVYACTVRIYLKFSPVLSPSLSPIPVSALAPCAVHSLYIGVFPFMTKQFRGAPAHETFALCNSEPSRHRRAKP